jgi:hypothetical protein
MRIRYRYDPATDKVVEAHQVTPRSGGVFVISDTMDAVAHPSTGKVYDSKSRFRAETRARGLVEVGNDKIPDRVDRSLPGGLRDEMSRVYDQLSSRR